MYYWQKPTVFIIIFLNYEVFTISITFVIYKYIQRLWVFSESFEQII